jgi:hypothetical protein
LGSRGRRITSTKKLETSLDHIVRPCLKKRKRGKKKKERGEKKNYMAYLICSIHTVNTAKQEIVVKLGVVFHTCNPYT